jgi:site-specific recombinase XerD
VDRGERDRGRKRQREKGPRIYREGRYFKADLRPYGGPRVSLRDPKAPGWPVRGERTEDPEVAHQWSHAYVAFYRDRTRHRQLGLHKRFPPLKQALDAYLEHRQNVVEENTYGVDKTAAMHLVEHFGAGASINHVAEHMQAIVDKRLAQGYAPSTIRTLQAAWLPFFCWLGFDRENNPARHIKRPAIPETEVETWSDDQLGELREAADWVDLHPVKGYMPKARLTMEAFVCTGVRQQEGFALDWQNFRRDEEAVRIVWQLRKNSKARKALKGKLARSAYVLPEFWQHAPENATGVVLASPAGGFVGYRTQRNLLRRILDVAKLYEAGAGYHRFRHTFSRIFIERGGRFEELQKFLGHKSIVTTQRQYGHFHEDVAVRNARLRLSGGGLRVVP